MDIWHAKGFKTRVIGYVAWVGDQTQWGSLTR
jgi:hypothetical protein